MSASKLTNPFIGLRPYQTSDRALFFGRHGETLTLFHLVEAVPIAVVYGPSGIGKSSLLNAGLVPKLEEDGRIIVTAISDPSLDIASAIMARDYERQPDSGEGGSELRQFLKWRANSPSDRLVVILDQFEERLKRDPSINQLFSDLAWLANGRVRGTCFVISIREDYLSNLEPLMRRIPGLLDAGYKVPQLSQSALTEAVRGPLGEAVDVSDDLIQLVLSDLEDEARPRASGDRRVESGYFQIVWSRLWQLDVEASGQSSLSEFTYRNEGSAKGIVGRFVSESVKELTPFSQEVLYAAIRYLVLPTGAKIPLTVDDLVGLMRPADYLNLDVGSLLQPRARVELSYLFETLTRADSPLLRRAYRSGREEFELVHDLLGVILLGWRRNREQSEVAGYSLDRVPSASSVFGRGHFRREATVSSLKEVNRRLEAIALGLDSHPSNIEAASDAISELCEQLRTLPAGSLPESYNEFFETTKGVDGLSAQVLSGVVNGADDDPSLTTDAPRQRAILTLTFVLPQIKSEATRAAALGSDRRHSSVVGLLRDGSIVVAAVFSGILGSNGLIQGWFEPPAISYLPLTLSSCAVAALVVMLLAIPTEELSTVLWPMRARPSKSWATVPQCVILMWPLPFLIWVGGGYAGAAFTDWLGMAAEVGFILGLILVAVPLGASFINIFL